MADSGLTPEERIEQALAERTAQLLFGAAMTLSVYDLLLSFNKEVEYIWRRKFSMVKILYFTIRYCTALSIFWNIIIRKSIFSSVPIFIVGVVTRSIAVGSDATVLFFTLVATLSTYRDSKKAKVKTRLTTTLIHNGFLQFLGLLAMNVIAVFLNIFSIASSSPTAPHATYFITLLDAVHSILLSNFMINLRSVYQSTGNLSDPGRQSLSIHFASSILGNIGAPLNSSWALNMNGPEQDFLDRIERNR
ncbi:hypothetical protein QCA50_021178 [Cerrena zonata]|uniref:DUF6533 domain-containing protein n=1 Tax=Cerrena zonata TaxID=2478898 RepID=A0AAW0FF83_9APHY